MSRTSSAVAELEVLAKQFGNQAQLALALDVEKSSVTRWLQGRDKPSADSEERITALRYIAFRLSRMFHPEVANDWLCSINAFLGNRRPMDLIRHGRISEVLAAIEQTDAGSYA